jgi:hypothetical protein
MQQMDDFREKTGTDMETRILRGALRWGVELGTTVLLPVSSEPTRRSAAL